MLSGRPGPVLVDVPMDVQAEAAVVTMPVPGEREARRGARPAAADIELAARLLAESRRPVIVAGGGAIAAEATGLVTALAERLGAPVVTTWMGKGAIDETHELDAWSDRRHRQHLGQPVGGDGRRPGLGRLPIHGLVCLLLASRRDVRHPADPRSIQIDMDPREIGKNYPVEVGLLGDAGEALADLLEALGPGGGPPAYRPTAYFEEIQTRRSEWEAFEGVEQRSGGRSP